MIPSSDPAGSPIRPDLIAAPPAAEMQATADAPAQAGVVASVLAAVSVSHLLNDLIQSLIVALYPMFKGSFQLTFGQIGFITLVYSLASSVLQPLIGYYTDRKAQPFSLSIGMGATLTGLVMMSFANTYWVLVAAGALVGVGSSVFHPEASRVARLVSGGRHGFAQSVFQVGGNLGSSLGPLCAAAFVIPHGQPALIWFSLLALLGIVVLTFVGRWHRDHLVATRRQLGAAVVMASVVPPRLVMMTLAILGLLIFSKYFYLVSLTNYYTFFLIDRFGMSVQSAQVYLFIFLFAVAAGTIFGGPIGDRIGRRRVIVMSILGVAPFALLLPHANALWTGVLSVVVGAGLASAFPAILVYAQELLPGRIGLVSGLFFGFAFGMGGIGAWTMGHLADHTSITFVYHVCAFLPLLGVLALFLPETGTAAVSGRSG